MPVDDAERRQGLISGLRALAQFYFDHPEAPLPPYPSFSHCVLADDDEAGSAEVQRVASALDVPVEFGAHISAAATFGAVSFRVYYVRKDVMRQHAAADSYYSSVETDTGGTS